MKNNYEWLDLIPQGWIDIGREMLQEIEKINPSFEVEDMKEKWGSLRTYGWEEDEATTTILHKYEHKSSKICCECGRPATKYSLGYILPFCDECAAKHWGNFKELK